MQFGEKDYRKVDRLKNLLDAIGHSILQQKMGEAQEVINTQQRQKLSDILSVYTGAISPKTELVTEQVKRTIPRGEREVTSPEFKGLKFMQSVPEREVTESQIKERKVYPSDEEADIALSSGLLEATKLNEPYSEKAIKAFDIISNLRKRTQTKLPELEKSEFTVLENGRPIQYRDWADKYTGKVVYREKLGERYERPPSEYLTFGIKAKEDLDKLEREKRGLERQLASEGIDLARIIKTTKEGNPEIPEKLQVKYTAEGELPIPSRLTDKYGKFVESEEEYNERMRKEGFLRPYEPAMKWLRLVGQLEEGYKQLNIPYKPIMEQVQTSEEKSKRGKGHAGNIR
jgi:hypothetical protein